MRGEGEVTVSREVARETGFFYVSCTVTEISINPAGPSSLKDRQCCAAVKTIWISDLK